MVYTGTAPQQARAGMPYSGMNPIRELPYTPAPKPTSMPYYAYRAPVEQMSNPAEKSLYQKYVDALKVAHQTGTKKYIPDAVLAGALKNITFGLLDTPKNPLGKKARKKLGKDAELFEDVGEALTLVSPSGSAKKMLSSATRQQIFNEAINKEQENNQYSTLPTMQNYRPLATPLPAPRPLPTPRVTPRPSR